MKFTGGIVAALLIGAGMAAPASATITTFASFNATGSGNMVWANNGTGGSSSTYRSNGTGGSIFTTDSPASVIPSSSVPGAVAVKFSFLQASLAAFVTNVDAMFTMSASVASSPAITAIGYDFEQNLSGTFSFVSSAPITIGSHTFAAGSNLLSGSFGGAGIAGKNFGTSGGLESSVSGGGTITFTSDFLDFSHTNDRDLSLSLGAITSLVANVNKGLNFASGKALRSFRATATGSFSSDPAPTVTALPEPQSWALLIAGFGLVGAVARRRGNRTVAA
jgi:hypothetical protein